MNYPKVFPDEHDIKLVLSDQCQVNYNTNIQQVPMWKQLSVTTEVSQRETR